MYSAITHKLTARSAVLHVNKTAPQSAYKFSEFYGTQNAYRLEKHTHAIF